MTEIIDALGGYKSARLRLCVARSTLALWEVDGIPPTRWVQIAGIARRLKLPITLETLAASRPSKQKGTRPRRGSRRNEEPVLSCAAAA